MTKGSRKQDFIEIGYKAGIVLSFLGILASATYLFVFINMSPNAGTIDNFFRLLSITAERRLLLLSTAIFVGMSFGFLGFALFLIQAKGDMDLDLSTNDYKLKIARLSPGLFVILCATVIIIVCATYPIDYKISQTSQAGGSSMVQNAPSVGTDLSQTSLKDVSNSVSDVEMPDVDDDELGLPETSKPADQNERNP